MTEKGIIELLAEKHAIRRTASLRLIVVITSHVAVGAALVTWGFLRHDGDEDVTVFECLCFLVYIMLWIAAMEYCRRVIGPNLRRNRIICPSCGAVMAGGALEEVGKSGQCIRCGAAVSSNDVL